MNINCNSYRFNLSHYLSINKMEESSSNAASSSGNEGIGRVYREAFAQLVDLYSKRIQRHLGHFSWQRVLYNKSVSQIFLDKISRLYPKEHCVVKAVGEYGYNSSTFASMEILHYLNGILESPELTEQCRKNINNWMIEERNSLPYYVFFDGVREGHAGIMAGLWRGDLSAEQSEKIAVDQKNLEEMVKELSEQIASLEAGASIKLLGGSLVHEVRLVITKDFDGDLFTLTSHDAMGKDTIIVKNLNKDEITSEAFLRDLVTAKFQANTDEVLKNFEGYSVCTDKNFKAVQLTSSCSFFSILKEFKFTFLSTYKVEEEGILQYKIIKSLMADYATQTERENIDPQLFKALEEKSRVRKRVFDLLEYRKDPERLHLLLNFYEKALAIFDPGFDFDAVKKSPTDAAIFRLDKRLSYLDAKVHLLPEDREKLYALYSENRTKLPVGVLMRSTIRRKYRDQLIKNSQDFSMSIQGSMTKGLSALFRYLPTSVERPVTEYLWGDVLRNNDLISFILSEMRDSEESELYALIEECIQLELIDSNDIFVFVMVWTHFERKDKNSLRVFLNSLREKGLFELDQGRQGFLEDMLNRPKDFYSSDWLSGFFGNSDLSDRSFLIKVQEVFDYGYSLTPVSNLMVSRLDREEFEKVPFIETVKFLLKKGQMSNDQIQQVLENLSNSGKIDTKEKEVLQADFKEDEAKKASSSD